MAFSGRYMRSIDAKGRLSLPWKLGIIPGEMLTATRGIEQCIYLYQTRRWQEIEKQFHAIGGTGEKERQFLRMILSQCEPCRTDMQARILLPRELADYADLTRDAWCVGVLDHIEIWNVKRFEAHVYANGAKYEDAARRVFAGA